MVDHLGDEVVALAANRVRRSLPSPPLDRADRCIRSARSTSSLVNTTRRSGQCFRTSAPGVPTLDQAPVLDDGDAIAEPLGLFHQVRREEHRRAAVPDVGHELPDRAARLRIEAGRELVEEHDLGLVDQRERDEQPLLLAAGERHEPGVALALEAEPRQERVAFGDAASRATPRDPPPPTP